VADHAHAGVRGQHALDALGHLIGAVRNGDLSSVQGVAYANASAAMGTVHPEMEEAARILGSGRLGTIARITEHLTARRTRAIALPKPDDRTRTEWYFQRYVHYLPAAGEIVIFNRSWYNRAGVEPVMGFCTSEEHKLFLQEAPHMERMLEHAGVRVLKIWLDISKDEHKKLETEVQNLTDQAVKRIDEALKTKEQEIMQV